MSNNYENLTERQKEVLGLIARGYSYKKIANILCISPSTVTTHRNLIYENLKLPDYNFRKPKELAIMVYWQNNIEELKNFKINERI